jgi:uncharacterized coiled-coil DUF342 family protein
MTLNERESQLKEYQTKGDQASQEIQDLRNALEEKNSKEKQLNDSINSLKQDFEKQIQSLKTQITQLENQSLYFSSLVLHQSILFSRSNKHQ